MTRLFALTALLLFLLVGWAQAEHGVPPAKCMAQYERLKAFSRERPAFPQGLDEAGQEAFLKEWKADREQRRQVEIERYEQCLAH